MPFKDDEARRAYNRERMRRVRAEGAATWETPEKEAARKARWYAEGGGKAKHHAAQRAARQRAKAQGLQDFIRKHA